MNEVYIDIGTNTIRALEKGANGEVLKWGKLERLAKPFHTSILPMDKSDIIKHLRILFAKMS